MVPSVKGISAKAQALVNRLPSYAVWVKWTDEEKDAQLARNMRQPTLVRIVARELLRAKWTRDCRLQRARSQTRALIERLTRRNT